ncbi:unnamed protein product [Blepharisma stoltei]|uniref:Dolichyl-diphosphooligosaccharide--protein glycosyltransferase subunit OST2 n=1 Tax=Blepharisma stoltei TaxID=1481888 RepID=A0AAU9JRY7_9CILI|nr:unnamed protein product [Blepharisma stoltei]
MASSVISSLVESFGILKEKYTKETKKRTKLVDLFIGFNLVLATIQYIYMKVAGSFPFNAFLSAFFCSIGTAVLTVCLRMQVENKSAGKSEEKAYVEYMFCCLILYLVSFNYLG